MSYRDSKHYRAVHELFIASGSNSTIDEFTRTLDSHLNRSPDPEMTLTNLGRFGEAVVSKASLFNDLLRYPVQMEVLMKLFGYSQYFADILVRDPELFRWLTAAESLAKPRTKEVLADEVTRALNLFEKPERKLDALKRLHRREILRVGARDILGEAGLDTVTRELSHLADVIVDASCLIAERQLRQRFPVPPDSPYAVIGLGKLGGCELNYSSDIDILFVYGDDGVFSDADGREVTYHEYYNKFVERVVQNLSQSSSESYLYRVDLRLRPESGMGPLARSLKSYIFYYESRGELWERQMLIKARAIAGDRGLGCDFVRQLEPFVYPRTSFQDPTEAIGRMKAKIEGELGGADNIKLRAGGIRDIEFAVQALQLLHGGKDQGVRTGNTLEAVERLSTASLLSGNEASMLKEAYTFFRTLEHRLQIVLNARTHSFPEDARAQTTLARRLGFQRGEELRAQLNVHLGNVRSMFGSVLAAGPKSEGLRIASIIEGDVAESAASVILKEFGFRDLHRAYRGISQLATGSGLAGVRELDSRARESLQLVAGQLFHELAATPSPDTALQNLVTLAAGQKFPAQLYNALREPKLRKLILKVCGVSPRYAKGLASHPLLLETLLSDPAALTGPALLSPLPAQTLHEFKDQEELRSGIRHLLGFISFEEFVRELTQIADTVVLSVFAGESKKQRMEKPPLALFALGKYGTHELSADADLDLVFIAGAVPQTKQSKLEGIARGIVHRLGEFTDQGKLYDVDVRLRPEGKSSPLVVEKDAYARYLRHRASLWERQSLTRFRFVCGDTMLGRDIMREVEKFVFESPLPSSWVPDVIGMRRKMESRTRTSQTDFHDIKLGAGGMVDIEFVAQMIQMRFGGQVASLRWRPTVEVLRLAEAEPAGLSTAAGLVTAYQLYRRIELLLRIALDSRTTILPEEEKLDHLARCLDGTDAERLRNRVVATMKTVRASFLEFSHLLGPV